MLNTVIPILGALVGAGAIAFVVFQLVERQQDRISARSVLGQLQDYEVSSERDKTLLVPLHTRLMTPVLEQARERGRRFNPPDYVKTVREKHLRAGIDKASAVETFLAVRVVLLAMIPFWLLFAFLVLPLGGLMRIVMAGVGVAALVILPNTRLDNKVKQRETAIRKALPDTLDLLVICVEAGLGFEQALTRVVDNVPGPLSKEFARMLGEVTAGSSRADALRNMQERVDIEEIRSFVLALIQADTFGVSIGSVLRGQADDMRIKRRQQAQERAQKAPVKMMLPMVFCIFPSLFIVILGPAAMNIYDEMVR